LFFALAKKNSGTMELRPLNPLIPVKSEAPSMLVERGLQVMNVEIVSEAYAIAANYLRRSGALPDTLATDDRLLKIIIKMFQHGELNKIRLANKAIAKFESEFEATMIA
jgi:hypothetical protein